MARGQGSRRSGVAVAIAAAVLAVVFAAGRVVTGGVAPAADCADPVDWVEASAHEGERVAVAGQVAAATFAPEVGGEPTFLNLGNPHPDADRFDVVIYRDVRDGFERPPDEVFAGHDVCVVGTVRVRDGVAQVILDRPGLIEVAETTP